MRFELFLNHLSASQTIKSRNSTSALDCYGTCSPYNCAIVSMEQLSTDRALRSIFERMMKWKTRAEDSTHLVYDPANNRLYEADEDGHRALNVIQNCPTYESFCALLKNDKKCDDLLTCIKAVYI